MTGNKNRAEKLATMLEALSDLAAEDLEAAKLVLRASGRDPEEILRRGLRRLDKVRAEVAGHQPEKASMPAEEHPAAAPGVAGLPVLLFRQEDRQVVMGAADDQGRMLTAREVYDTFVAQQPLSGNALEELQLSAEVRAVRFQRMSRELKLMVHMQAEYAELTGTLSGRPALTAVLVPAEIAALVSTGYLLRDGVCSFVDAESLPRAAALLAELNSDGYLPLNRALYWFAQRHAQTWLSFTPDQLDMQQILHSGRYAGTSALFVRDLYDYQQDGLQWLQYCCINRIGGILGDDMGLGKTAETIALIAWLVENELLPHILVVVPSTLLENWRREFAFFTPSLTPYIHHGAGRTGSIAVLAAPRIVVTSYSMIVNDQYLFNKIDWGLVLLDEASLIKNPDATRRQALVDVPAAVRIAMSGTPVENSLMDLWSLADFANPGYLGTRAEFSSRYIRREIQQTLASLELPALKNDISHVMLRRRKEDVLDSLPEKIDIHQALEMSVAEAVAYEQQREAVMGQAGGGAGTQMLRLIQVLRQFTTHPLLAVPEQLLAADLTQLTDGSVKLKRTVELLDEIRSRGEKVLIFTEYLAMIDALQRTLAGHYRTSVTTIDGRVPVSERQSRIDAFSAEEGFAIMVLNPRTAGMGLNITAANHVIHYTRQWNPALEEQATARAYRNRQTRGVNAYYLYYADTIEEVIDERLRAKSALSGEVVTVTETQDGMDRYLQALNLTPFKK